MIRRLPIVIVVVAAMLLLTRLDDPHRVTPDAVSPLVGAALDTDRAASTWYCAAAGAATAEAVTHQLIIMTPDAAVTAHVTGYRTTSGETVTSTIEVPAHSQQIVAMADLAPDVGGATVEIEGGAATVAHRLFSADASDQSECVTDAGTESYFAAANTQLGATARVWLLNPFPTDASVDIRTSLDDGGVRVPKSLRGIIVPAKSSRMVDLNEEAAQRRSQFAFAVQARGGRVIAELAQTCFATENTADDDCAPTGSGLRLQAGATTAANRWVFADSFGGAGVTEQLVVFNPSEDDTTVSVSVVPNDTPPESFPEPFLLDVPARRYATIDLTAEARVSPDVLRWIQVDDGDGDGVVVTKRVGINGAGGDGSAGGRPTVTAGLSSTSASSAQATRWFITSADPAPDSQSVIVIANPARDAIALVDISVIAAGATVAVQQQLEVPPLASLAVDLAGAIPAGAPVGLTVDSSNPVVVSARATSVARSDLAQWVPIAQLDTVSPLAAAGGS